jgi:hypothetical protein
MSDSRERATGAMFTVVLPEEAHEVLFGKSDPFKPLCASCGARLWGAAGPDCARCSRGDSYPPGMGGR